MTIKKKCCWQHYLFTVIDMYRYWSFVNVKLNIKRLKKKIKSALNDAFSVAIIGSANAIIICSFRVMKLKLERHTRTRKTARNRSKTIVRFVNHHKIFMKSHKSRRLKYHPQLSRSIVFYSISLDS